MSAFNDVGDVDRKTSNEFEGKIRESLGRNVSQRRPAMVERGVPARVEADDLNSLIERVSGATISEIDRLISELQKIRSLLHSEGERVRGEITGYAGLSQSAVATMKVVADTLTQLRPYKPTLPPRMG